MPSVAGRDASADKGGSGMKEEPINKLVEIAGPALSDATPRIEAGLSDLATPLESQLLKLYWARNGFYAFESALHVFPMAAEPEVISLEQWNSANLWRAAFGSLALGALFFAEDAFGGQFCIADGGVVRFNPETGEREQIAASIYEWAAVILADSRMQTGWPLAHDWQARYGPLALDQRLVPKIPFVLGGEYVIQNLHALDCVAAMHFYADIARQIHDLADGSQVRLRVVD
jgi:hypothetical protein